MEESSEKVKSPEFCAILASTEQKSSEPLRALMAQKRAMKRSILRIVPKSTCVTCLEENERTRERHPDSMRVKTWSCAPNRLSEALTITSSFGTKNHSAMDSMWWAPGSPIHERAIIDAKDSWKIQWPHVVTRTLKWNDVKWALQSLRSAKKHKQTPHFFPNAPGVRWRQPTTTETLRAH